MSETGRLLVSLRYLLGRIKSLELDRKFPTRKRIVDRFVLKLDVEIVIFENTLSNLIGGYTPVVKTQWDVVEPLLRGRCGSFYGRYLESVGQMLSATQKVAELMGLDHDEAPWRLDVPHAEESCPALANDQTQDDSHYARLFLAISDIDESLGGSMAACLLELQHGIQNIIGIDRLDPKKPPQAEIQRLENLRTQVKQASDILGRDAGFECSHKSLHRVFLRIDDWAEQEPDDLEQKPLESIGISFSLVFGSMELTCPWNWADMRSQVTEIPPQDLPNRPSSLSSSRSGAEQYRRKKFTRFAGDLWQTGVQRVQAKMARRVDPAIAGSNLAARVSRLTTSPALGLCSYLEAWHSQDLQARPSEEITLQCERDRKLRLSRGNLAQDHTHGWSNVLSVQHKLTQAGKYPLSTEQKLRLALKVASSLFYLYSTPWLGQKWSSQDIHLIEQHSGPTLPDPLVCAPSGNPEENSGSQERTQPQHEQIILCLGRFLIELWHGAPWERIREAYLPFTGMQELENLDPNNDYIVVNKIFSWACDTSIAPQDKPFHQEGLSYMDAARNCFEGDFGHAIASFEDDYFREGVYLKVLSPLKYALQDFCAAQDSVFGNLATKSLAEMQDEELPTSGFNLFDDEEVVENMQTKYKLADDWFVEYAGVKKLARKLRPRQKNPENRIRIAILDTGVDVSDDVIAKSWQRRQIIYQNFAPGGSPTELPEDAVGHGTHITSIVLRVAPNADVYVARVSADGKTFSSAQVAKAIRWAVEDKKVHIISMSFGFPRLEEDLEPIRCAILDAHAADVLIFAAASNDGGNFGIKFPASLDEVISVGSTDGKGNKSSFTPSLRSGKRLCTLGEGIAASWPRKLSPDKKTQLARKSGTSYATPIAAGVAAMIMDYMWSVKDDPEYKYLVQKFRTKRGMLAAMTQMFEQNSEDRDEKNPVDYLAPWKLFNPIRNGDKDVQGEKLSGAQTTKPPPQSAVNCGKATEIGRILLNAVRMI